LSLDKTILLLAGKTTLLRDITCMLADKFYKLVMVVDTNEEIAGGGNFPHACIGTARRMLGTANQSKHQVMQEAVANHGPEVKTCFNQHCVLMHKSSHFSYLLHYTPVQSG